MTGCLLTLELPGDQLAGLLGSGGGAVGVAVEEEPSSGQQRSQQHQHGDGHTWCRSQEVMVRGHERLCVMIRVLLLTSGAVPWLLLHHRPHLLALGLV